MAAHEEIMMALSTLQTGVNRIAEQVTAQNGRVRKCENNISALRWAVYVGGAAISAALGYLIQNHLYFK